jgi:16S rRNA (adenine(1408)-N(1))-methyltransferase
VGAGDGRFVLSRATEHPEELVLAIDASHAAMREASRRAARAGMPNALFVASALDQLPSELAGLASLVTVQFPWGTLLDAANARDAAGTDRLAALVGPSGRLRLLLSASVRDASRGLTALEPEAIVAAYRHLGFELVVCRPASDADIAASRSSWGRRLTAVGGDRRTWLLELRRVESGGGGAMHRVRP